MGTVMAMKEAGALTPNTLSSLLVQFLPILTQRLARKVDKIGHMTRKGLTPGMRDVLECMATNCKNVSGLERFHVPLQKALVAAPGPLGLGETILDLAKALQNLPFPDSIQFLQELSPKLMELLNEWEKPAWWQWLPVQVLDLDHAGAVCDGCGVTPLVGPRFRCNNCADYDLCGNCYPFKETLHGDQGGAQHSFHCLLKPDGKGLKGRWKGRGKWHEHCESDGQQWDPMGKGWWKKAKGQKGWWGKGLAPYAQHFMQHLHMQEEPWQMPQEQQFGCGWEPFLAAWGKAASCKGNVMGQSDLWPHGVAERVMEHLQPQARQAPGAQHRQEETRGQSEEGLHLLREMGLGHEDLNRELLTVHGGDVSAVAQLLAADKADAS